MKTELEKAINVLKKNLKEDVDYRMGWQANIAVMFQDEFDDWCKNKVGRNKAPDHIHAISNNAANRFLNNLCG